jgi:hypothetical protein
MSYESFQNKVSSEKLTLAIVQASKRLMAWTLHSGSIYKLTNFDVQAIVSIEDSGNAYTEVQSIAACTASKFYNDRDNKILYLRTTGSDNPNSRFLVLTQKLFFSTGPIVLPHDLASGNEVQFEPTIKSTSLFGVSIDTINQTSEAIEGSGTLTLYNDSDFWPKNFDKLVLENQSCFIYSHNRDLLPSEAKLIFQGVIEKKAYTPAQIQLSLKDLLSQLQDPVPLANIGDLGLRTKSDLEQAKQRMILGRVHGLRCVNADEVLEGYPLAGTISINLGSDTITGSGTSFLSVLSPDDKLIIDGTEYTIATVVSDTSVTLTEVLGGTQNYSGLAVTVMPNKPKRTMNRTWIVAGHALRQPTTTVTGSCSITRLRVGSTADMRDGDLIWIGTYPAGELVEIDSVVNSQLLVLKTSLATIPSLGTSIFRPAIQSVRIDDVLLRFKTDYTFNATTGIITLSNDAESNAAPLRKMPTTLAFTNGSRIITGTSLKTTLEQGSIVSCVNHGKFFEVLSVDSDTQATLRTAADFTDTQLGLYKTFILDPQNSVVTCDVLGRTDDSTSTGNLLKTAPKIIRQLLIDMGLSASLNETSFTESNELAYQQIGIALPETYSDETAPKYRDVFNKLNASVFGSIVQNSNFELSYVVLQPDKKPSTLKLDEVDVIDFGVATAGDKIVKTTIVSYKPKEYDYLTKDGFKNYKQNTSDTSSYLLKTKRERTFDTYLVEEADARRHAERWSLILENSAATITLNTKLQAIGLEVGSIVDLTHRKMYERFGTSSSRKLGLVESVKKSGSEVQIEVVDLSNAFNKIANISDLTTSRIDTNEDGRIYCGFYTDTYGIIDDDQDSYGTSRIW